MSEDRHTFSEPRPIPGLELPTWDVDVFRDGVPEPILTLRIDEKTLPARKSKKKKVVWKLPDSVDQIPRFGIDEKRRLLDLFKNLKKERRKSKQKRGSGIDLTGIDEDDLNNLNEPQTINSNGKKEEVQQLASAVDGMTVEEPPHPKPPSTNGKHSSLSPAPPGLPSRALSAPVPPGMNPQPANNTVDAVGSGRVPNPPPGMNRARSDDGLSSPPPPGLTPIARAQSQTPPQIKEPPVLNQQRQHPPLQKKPQPPPPQQQQQQAPAQPRPSAQMQAPQPAPVSAPLPSLNPVLNMPLIPPVRFLKFPPGMHVDIFAQQVANLYITLLNSGQVDELALYYTLTAQKSLSLKSAKSICTTPMEMKTQLTSLVACVFAVQGITVQQGLNSLLLIWSGLCQLQGQQHGFCHTIVLVPIPTQQGVVEETGPQYQIQNDALVLLTNE